MVSNLGKIKATSLLTEIYGRGKMVDEDGEESKRLFGIVEEGIVYTKQKDSNGE